jgi:hypothetical protein
LTYADILFWMHCGTLHTQEIDRIINARDALPSAIKTEKEKKPDFRTLICTWKIHEHTARLPKSIELFNVDS